MLAEEFFASDWWIRSTKRTADWKMAEEFTSAGLVERNETYNDLIASLGPLSPKASDICLSQSTAAGSPAFIELGTTLLDPVRDSVHRVNFMYSRHLERTSGQLSSVQHKEKLSLWYECILVLGGMKFEAVHFCMYKT
ncbi:hypothetical protein AVEN_61534-1 [Araneus ventricosus]|uniref:Uncharacterized protein n=1 Tax=Araneus ventricosus TaxID=182803 RepID=A0A4Y2I8V1_ARAVE|nr:hypothetical protein AVEN_61534-1 [Araneus ventricosus]